MIPGPGVQLLHGTTVNHGTTATFYYTVPQQTLPTPAAPSCGSPTFLNLTGSFLYTNSTSSTMGWPGVPQGTQLSPLYDTNTTTLSQAHNKVDSAPSPLDYSLCSLPYLSQSSYPQSAAALSNTSSLGPALSGEPALAAATAASFQSGGYSLSAFPSSAGTSRTSAIATPIVYVVHPSSCVATAPAGRLPTANGGGDGSAQVALPHQFTSPGSALNLSLTHTEAQTHQAATLSPCGAPLLESTVPPPVETAASNSTTTAQQLKVNGTQYSLFALYEGYVKRYNPVRGFGFLTAASQLIPIAAGPQPEPQYFTEATTLPHDRSDMALFEHENTPPQGLGMFGGCNSRLHGGRKDYDGSRINVFTASTTSITDASLATPFNNPHGSTREGDRYPYAVEGGEDSPHDGTALTNTTSTPDEGVRYHRVRTYVGDIFVHQSNVHMKGFRSLPVGGRVRFQVGLLSGQNAFQAINVELLPQTVPAHRQPDVLSLEMSSQAVSHGLPPASRAGSTAASFTSMNYCISNDAEDRDHPGTLPRPLEDSLVQPRLVTGPLQNPLHLAGTEARPSAIDLVSWPCNEESHRSGGPWGMGGGDEPLIELSPDVLTAIGIDTSDAE